MFPCMIQHKGGFKLVNKCEEFPVNESFTIIEWEVSKAQFDMFIRGYNIGLRYNNNDD